MGFKWILPILLMKNICCEVNNGHHKQARSISALKTPRFNILSGNFEDEHSPENYFPEMEYPSDILDLGKPYFFKASDNPVLEPFPREVKDSFKYITSGGKNVKEVSHIEYNKPAQSILKSNSNVPGNEAIVSDKKNVTNETVKTQGNDFENDGNNTITLHQINFTNETMEKNPEVLVRPSDNSTEIFDSSEIENYTVENNNETLTKPNEQNSTVTCNISEIENCNQEESPNNKCDEPDEEEATISDELLDLV